MKNESYQVISESEEQTEQIGEKLARTIKDSCIVALFGPLGAGKTAFTRGFARGLECCDRVSSPTYTIVNEYNGRLRLCHFDMYRLENSDALYDIGWSDYINSGKTVCIIEWSERIADVIPPDALTVKISKDNHDGGKRLIEIENSNL